MLNRDPALDTDPPVAVVRILRDVIAVESGRHTSRQNLTVFTHSDPAASQTLQVGIDGKQHTAGIGSRQQKLIRTHRAQKYGIIHLMIAFWRRKCRSEGIPHTQPNTARLGIIRRTIAHGERTAADPFQIAGQLFGGKSHYGIIAERIQLQHSDSSFPCSTFRSRSGKLVIIASTPRLMR